MTPVLNCCAQRWTFGQRDHRFSPRAPLRLIVAGDAYQAGVVVPNCRQVAGFALRAGATVLSWLARRFEGIEDDVQTTHLVAAAVATEQAMQLVDEGIKHFHFYTLNRADLVYAICHLLGLRSKLKAAA